MNPYHFVWQWSYTAIVLVLLLSLFLLLGALLLLRRGGRRECSRLSRYRQTPESVSTPQGYFPYWNEQTQKLATPGIERARTRHYATKGKY